MAEKDDKQALITLHNKMFPGEPIEDMAKSSLANISGWISTGNYALNWAASKDIWKGLAIGRVHLFSGNAGAGKSLIALNSMKSTNINLIILMDSEAGASKDFAEFLGVDPGKVMYIPIDTTELMIQKMKAFVDYIEKNKITKNTLIVIDSMSMISTEREQGEDGKADMGNKTKQVREFFRQYTRKIQKLNIAVVMTAHLTTNIGGYGDPMVVSGGTIMSYIPSTELRFSKINAESTNEQNAVGTSIVKIQCEVKKSRFGTYGKRIKFG